MKFLKGVLIVLMAFSLAKPTAQLNKEELNILWSLVSDTIKFEISDSLYQYLEDTNYDTLVSELERNDSSVLDNKLFNPFFCLRIGEYFKSNFVNTSQYSIAKQKSCYFFRRAADLIDVQNLNQNPKLLKQQYWLLKYASTERCNTFNIGYSEKRLTISKALKDTTKICDDFIQIARKYKQRTDVTSAKKYLDSAYYYYYALKPSLAKEELSFSLFVTNGEFLLFERDYENAYILFQNALKVAQKLCRENPESKKYVRNEFKATRNLSS